MRLIEEINEVLEWEPCNIFYNTSTEYCIYDDTQYTIHNYTKLGEAMRTLPTLVEGLLKFVYYIIAYPLYYTFIKIPWWIFTGVFIPQRWL